MRMLAYTSAWPYHLKHHMYDVIQERPRNTHSRALTDGSGLFSLSRSPHQISPQPGDGG